jgi:hypothetical protein
MNNTSKIRAVDLKVSKDHLQVLLEDGRIVVVPLAWYPRLMGASRKDLLNYQWIGKGLGIHWSALDEDLSVEGFLRGLKAPANQFKKVKSSFLTPKRLAVISTPSSTSRRTRVA